MKNVNIIHLLIVVMSVYQVGCGRSQQGQNKNEPKYSMNMKKTLFGNVGDKQVYLFTLVNDKGMVVKITNYGGIITELQVPDKEGKLTDVVLGYNTLDEYLHDTPYFGAIVGRYGNRIAKGKFAIDGQVYTLACNNGPNHLHGGLRGFDKVIWDAEDLIGPDSTGVVLSYFSPDGEEGYPGNLKAQVTYMLTNDNELKIAYDAETDKPTVINLTHHSYFNLRGEGAGDILNHQLQIHADRFTPVDETLIPTGELKGVEGTAMDFRIPTPIGARIASVEGGYDHNFVLNHTDGRVRLVATATEPETGRKMEVFTDQPGLQFYSGNFLDGSNTGKRGKPYNKHFGFCLETQHFPDSPNHADFPPVVLRPGEKYRTQTIYKFGVAKE